MSQIIYNLTNGSRLGCMVPPMYQGGAWGNATLPLGLAGQGMYIIVNQGTNNRYAGTSTNLTKRFSSRMATVTEMGFSEQEMNQIIVFWGTVSTQNTPGYMGNPNPAFSIVGNYAPPVDAQLDGATVNLERLLIRYMLLHLGAGGTVSNNLLAYAPYTNPTASAVTVTLNWTPGYFTTSTSSVVWGVNQAW